MNLSHHYRCPLRAFLRGVVVLVVMMGLLAACGEPQVQTDATNALTLDARGAYYLALQDGLGDWQRLSASQGAEGLMSVSLTDPQGRYRVMSVCLDESSGAVSVQVKQGVLSGPSLDTGTVPTVTPVRLSCVAGDVSEGRTEVRGPVRGLEDGEYGSLYLGSASALIDASAPVTALEVQGADARERDLVATQYARNARLPSALIIVRGLTFSQGGVTPIDLDFASQDALPLAEAEVPLTGQRRGELLSGSVDLLTPSGTRALLGEAVANGSLGYARPPEAILRGAALQAEAQSFSYNDRTKAGSSRSISRTFPGGAVVQLALPPPLELRAPALTGRDGALRPRSRWKAQGATEGDYAQFYSQVQAGHSVSYRFTQSLGALRVRFPEAATYTQTLPDFSNLPDWQAEWNLTRGEDLFWDVSWSSETDEGAASSSRSGVLRTLPTP